MSAVRKTVADARFDHCFEHGRLPDAVFNAHNVVSSTLCREAKDLITRHATDEAKAAKAWRLVKTGYRAYTNALIDAHPRNHRTPPGGARKFSTYDGRRSGYKWLPKGERAKNVKYGKMKSYSRSRRMPSFSPKDVKHSLAAIAKEIIFLLKCELGILAPRGYTEAQLRRRKAKTGAAHEFRHGNTFRGALAAATKEKEERARAEQQASRAARAAARGRRPVDPSSYPYTWVGRYFS